MRGRRSVCILLRTVSYDGTRGRRSIRLEPRSNRIHHWELSQIPAGQPSAGRYGHGNIAGARSHLRWRQRTILDFIESLNSLLAPIA